MPILPGMQYTSGFYGSFQRCLWVCAMEQVIFNAREYDCVEP